VGAPSYREAKGGDNSARPQVLLRVGARSGGTPHYQAGYPFQLRWPTRRMCGETRRCANVREVGRHRVRHRLWNV